MKRKKLVIAGSVVIALIAASTFYLHSKAKIGRSNKRPSDARQNVRPQDIYEQMFRHYAMLQRKAQDMERNHQDGNGPRTFYQRQGRLSDRQSRDLDLVATDCVDELERLDGRAKELIDQTRALVPGGQLQKDQTSPPAPAELDRLQEKREAKVLQARDQLRLRLGEGEFGRFDEFVHRLIAASMKSSEPGDGYLKLRPNPRQSKRQ